VRYELFWRDIGNEIGVIVIKNRDGTKVFFSFYPRSFDAKPLHDSFSSLVVNSQM
jgi:hypothetical protein